jgi:ubiquinone/menaquinone biosynthesis C-methylase UbiE
MNTPNLYKRKSQSYFDTSAAGYDKSSDMGIRPVLLASILERLKDIPQKDSILDVGCGTGELIYQLQAYLNTASAGLDLSDNMLEVARKKLGSSVDLRQGDAENLPWQNNQFDLVFCTLSFHHYPQPIRALEEIRRVLKHGGSLILADISMPSLVNLILPLLATGDRHFYSRDEMTNLLNQTGYKAINWQKVDGSTFLILASVP